MNLKTRYYKLKLVLAPFNAMCAAAAAHPSVPDVVRTWSGIFATGGIALWGLVNEVPRKSDPQTDGSAQAS